MKPYDWESDDEVDVSSLGNYEYSLDELITIATFFITIGNFDGAEVWMNEAFEMEGL